MQSDSVAVEARQGERSTPATNTHRRRVHKANAFFKIAERGNDKSDADITWYIEQDWVDVNVQDRLQCNAAHYAVAKNRPTLVAWLARHGIDMNHPNKRGRTPLHSAAEKGRPAMIDVLMANGAAASMGVYDKEGNTPFHVAVMNCELHAVRAFLKHGADRTHPTQHGKAPEDIAGSNGNRNLHMLGAVRSLLTAGSQAGGSVVSESSSFDSGAQAASITGILGLRPQQSVESNLSGWDSLSLLHGMRPDVRDQDAPVGQAPPAALVGPGAPEGPAGNRADKPENVVLAVSLVRKLMPMLQAAQQFSATPRLQSSLSLVPPLLNSLHKALSRQHPPGDIEPHLNPMLSTLVEMWRVVEKASKPPKGLAGRVKRSLSLNGGSKVDADLDRLDGELHVALGGLSTLLLQHNSALMSESPQSGRSVASSSPRSQAIQPPAIQVPASPQSVLSVDYSSSPSASLPPGTPPALTLPQLLAPQTSAPSSSYILGSAPLTPAAAGSLPLHQPPGGAADVMVGMEQVVSEIMGLLQAQSEGRVVLLLHGLVGVGKTAAARATFERIGRGLAEGVLAHWVGLRPGLSTSELLGRQRSMRWTLAGHTTAASAAARTLADGRSGMRGLLEGRKALLVVDGASGSQLEQLFPSDIMTLLAPSSILLLTSRDAHAAAVLQLPPGSSVLSYNVRPLSDELAVELFCRRAFKSAWPNSHQEVVVREAVEQGGGLPLAVEAMALACSKGESDPDLFRLYADGNANKLFRSLHEAVGLLTAEERQALQDVAVFFVGADWGAVEAYCGEGVLAALERSGLVEREPAGTVGVAYAVEAFCEAVQQDRPGQARMNVEREEDRDAPLIQGVRGVCFQGVDLQLQAATQQHLDHRMLLLDGCMLYGQLQWSFQQLQWLSWRGPQMSGFVPAGRMEPLVQPGLRVLLLEHLPFDSVDLQSLQGLKHLILADMPHLRTIEGLPQLTQLTHIELRSCPLLNALKGRPLPPNLRHLHSTPSHPSPPPSLNWVNNSFTTLTS